MICVQNFETKTSEQRQNHKHNSATKLSENIIHISKQQ